MRDFRQQQEDGDVHQPRLADLEDERMRRRIREKALLAEAGAADQPGISGGAPLVTCGRRAAAVAEDVDDDDGGSRRRA